MAIKRLRRLLYEKCIDYTEIKHYDAITIKIDNAPVSFIWWGEDAFWIKGLGYSGNGIFEYSAEYCANVAEKHFIDEMELLRKGAAYCEVTNCPYNEGFLPCAAANSCAGFDLGV